MFKQFEFIMQQSNGSIGALWTAAIEWKMCNRTLDPLIWSWGWDRNVIQPDPEVNDANRRFYTVRLQAEYGGR